MIHTKTQKDTVGVFAVGLAFILLLIVFYQLPVGIDWLHAHETGRDILHYDRYEFIGIPLSLVFVPHVLLPLRFGSAINLALNFTVPMLVLRRHKVGVAGFLAVYLCPLFYITMANNNIDWLPLVGFLLPPQYGAALIALKPQALAGILIVWIKRHGFKVMVSLPLIGIIILIVWGLTPLSVMRQADVLSLHWNFAPFPYLIPVGLYLLATAYRNDDTALAACATPFLVPYIASYTLPMTLTILATKYPKAALAVTVGLWWLIIVMGRYAGHLP